MVVQEGRTQMQSSKLNKGLFLQTRSKKKRTEGAAGPDIQNYGKLNKTNKTMKQDYGTVRKNKTMRHNQT